MLEWITPDQISALTQVLTWITFVVVAFGGWMQLKTIQEQNETIQEQNETIQEQNDISRIVEWKNSLQNVNNSILEHPDSFLRVLYPPPQSVEEMKRSIAAYSILNALETVYYMRKNIDGEKIEDIREFLKTYISHKNSPIEELWKEEAYRSAFTSEFQTEISEIFKKSNKSPSTSPPAADTRDGRSESRVSD